MGSLLALYKGAGAVFIGKVGKIVFGLSLQLLLVRMLTVEEYGLYAYVIALVAVFAVPVQLGLHIPILRFTSSLISEGKSYELTRFLGFSIGVGLVSSLLMCLVGQLLLFGFSSFINYETKFALQIGLVLIFFRSALLMFSRALLGFRRMAAAHWLENIVLPLAMIVLVAIVSSFLAISFEAVLIIRVIVVGIIAIVSLKLLWSGLPSSTFKSLIPNAEHRNNIFSVALPMLFASTISILANKLDVLLAGQLLSMAEVAQYAVVKRVAAISGFGLAAILAACSPFISAASSLGKTKSLANILFASALLSTVFALSILGLIALIGSSSILIYFGEQYLAGSGVLVVLLLGQLLDSAFGVTGMLMVMTGHQRVFLQSVVLGLVVSVVSIATLSMALGLEGVAWGFVVGMVTKNIYMVVYSLRVLNVNPTVFSLLWTKKEQSKQILNLLIEIKRKVIRKLLRVM